MGLISYTIIAAVTSCSIWVLWPVFVQLIDGDEAAAKVLKDDMEPLFLWGFGLGAVWPLSLVILGFIGSIFIIGFIGKKMFSFIMGTFFGVKANILNGPDVEDE